MHKRFKPRLNLVGGKYLGRKRDVKKTGQKCFFLCIRRVFFTSFPTAAKREKSSIKYKNKIFFFGG